jgi:hypothetical protein
MDQEIEKLWWRATQLEEQGTRDSRALIPLIQVYGQLLEHLQPDKESLRYAIIQNNLGYGYYQEAMRFWITEPSPLDSATSQHNLGVAYIELPTGDSLLPGALHFFMQETATMSV